MFLRAGAFIRKQEVVTKPLEYICETIIVQSCKDLAAILLDNTMGDERDINLHQRDGGLQRIKDRYPAFDPPRFTVLFPHSELGWHLAVRYQGDATSHNNNV
jgi:hypothetical protein